MKKVKILVKDMHCVNCSITLQGLEDSLPGIKTVDASYRSQSMVVNYDESLIEVSQILNAVRELGYSPEDCKEE